MTSVSQVLGAADLVTKMAVADPLSHTAINLTGNALDQMITGNAGDNIINGMGGNDTMIGLGGNDTYLVRGPGDVVIEANSGGQDTVFTTVSYSMGESEVEILSTVTQIDTTPINLTGNFTSQTVIGNYGNNVISGGYGTDTLIGLKGDDTYIVYDSNTQVIENAGEGTDVVLVGVNYTLAPGASVEQLIVQDRSSTTGFRLGGNEVSQLIAGGQGADTINGGGGIDTLIGGGGADHFVFSTPLGNGNVDILADFQPGVDKIDLSRNIFSSLPAGTTLSADNFAMGKAADANDYIIYDQSSGQIFYDADGSGSGAAVLFAVVSSGTALTFKDFEVMNTGVGA